MKVRPPTDTQLGYRITCTACGAAKGAPCLGEDREPIGYYVHSLRVERHEFIERLADNQCDVCGLGEEMQVHIATAKGQGRLAL